MLSAMVGCACMVAMMSSTVPSSALATQISWISSLAFSPMMWPPRISPYFLLTMIFTRPSAAPSAMALPWLFRPYLPTRYSMPFSLAPRSVRPTLATCGLQ